MSLTRPLPSNLETERYVISACIADEPSATFALNVLDIDDFTDSKHIAIFKALKAIKKADLAISIHSILSMLSEQKSLDTIVSSDDITELMNEFIDDAPFKDSVKALIDKKLVRETIETMDRSIDEYYEKNNKFKGDFEYVVEVENRINAITSKRPIEGFKKLSEINAIVNTNIEIARNSTSKLLGYSTGYYDVDKITSGLQKKQLIVLAARPAVGKTAFGINLCYNVAKKYNEPVLIFSAEMDEASVGTRILSLESNINGEKIMVGNISKDELLKLNKAEQVVGQVPVYVSYCNGSTIGEIVNKTTKFKSDNNGKLAMIMVDYIGLIKTGQREESLRVEIGKITHALKKLSIDLDIPVLAVCQVRRADPKDRGKNLPPTMNDLKESGDIEQDADKVILLYREDYENQGQKDDLSETVVSESGANVAKVDPNTSLTEIILAKNRNGRVGRAILYFFKTYQRFSSPERDVVNQYLETHNRNSAE